MREMIWRRRGGLWAGALVVLLLVGCSGGDGPELYDVSGSVTLDGAPLQTGAILFGAEGEGGSGGATIVDGEYTIPQSQGLPAGRYRVQITSAESTAPEEEMPGDSLAVENIERIPAKYNTASEEYVEVTADGDNTFDYDIQSEGAASE